jgi:hypothetical protein
LDKLERSPQRSIQELTDRIGAPFIQLCLLLDALNPMLVPARQSNPLGNLARQGRALLQQPHARPKGSLKLLGFVAEQVFSTPGVPNMATEMRGRAG